MNAHDLSAIIKSRRSIRRYLDRTVPAEIIHRLLDAACWAPSAHNRQPWRFAVITQPARRVVLAERMGQRFRADLIADGLDVAQVERQVARSYERISSAPVVMVICLSMADMDHYPDQARQQNERIMAVQSVALAVQNLLLMAHAEGLGACWMCAPLFCPDIVREALALPKDWEAQALVTLGYPTEQRVSEREPLEAKTLWY